MFKSLIMLELTNILKSSDRGPKINNIDFLFHILVKTSLSFQFWEHRYDYIKGVKKYKGINLSNRAIYNVLSTCGFYFINKFNDNLFKFLIETTDSQL